MKIGILLLVALLNPGEIGAFLFVVPRAIWEQQPLVFCATKEQDGFLEKMSIDRERSNLEDGEDDADGTIAKFSKSKDGLSDKEEQSINWKSSSKVSLRTQLDYARNGHAVLRNVINPSTLKKIRKQVLGLAAKEELKAWQQKVQVASNSPSLASSCHTIEQCVDELSNLGITSSLPFLQFFNTWRSIQDVQDLAYSLGQTASILLDCPSVRLYQDSVFLKRTFDGPTPWHVDARMAPFDTSHFLTFWIPLQHIGRDGTGLLFASKSQCDFALPYWNPIAEAESTADEYTEWDRLEHRYPLEPVHYMPMNLSDVTVHSGWTLHCADANDHSQEDRIALAISFVDAAAEVRSDVFDDASIGDNEDGWSYQDWIKEIHPRQPIQHPLVPIVWPLQ